MTNPMNDESIWDSGEDESVIDPEVPIGMCSSYSLDFSSVSFSFIFVYPSHWLFLHI